MSILQGALNLTERGLLPDAAIRLGIGRLCRQRLDEERSIEASTQGDPIEQFAAMMADGPIAPVPEIANQQHYELPAEFFAHVLGPRRKYSSCYFSKATSTLEAAEDAALRITAQRADLRDGQRVLDLGCGWGSFSLWAAEHHPGCRITALSNSRSQRRFIEAEAARRGLDNLTVITDDINQFATEDRFDRIVSIEMFEHMRNYQALLARIADWLDDDGALLVHVFCHRRYAYRFETQGSHNWLGRHFFTGGIMPSEELLKRFDRDLSVSDQWRWDGTHYQRTAEAWLTNLDTNRDRVMPLLAATYGSKDAGRWFHRWRVFFMACAELFGYRGGNEWVVAHYRLLPARTPASAVG